MTSSFTLGLLISSALFTSVWAQKTTNIDEPLEMCCDQPQSRADRVTVPLGYLTAVKGDLYNRQGRAISGALSFAIEQINNCSCILPDVEIEFIYQDTEGKENKSTKAVVDLICDDIAAFIGPEGPNCHTEAMVAGSKNRAMISYRCTDAQIASKAEYPTFTRMEPPDTQVTSSVLSLLEFYKWRKFSIVFQEGDQWETIAKHLNEQVSQAPKRRTRRLNPVSTAKDQLLWSLQNYKSCSINQSADVNGLIISRCYVEGIK